MPEEGVDWRQKFADIVTRKAYYVSSSLKLNPHEP
jgi:hypothetical protein